MQTSMLITVTPDQLSQIIRESVKDELNAFKGNLITKSDNPEYLSKKEAAKILRVNPNTLDLWVKRGLIKRYTISSRIRFISSEIREFAETPNARRYSTKLA